MITTLVCGLLWLLALAALVAARRPVAALGALAGGGAGLALWSALLLGPATTVQIVGGEFAWLPYVSVYPLMAVLAGALLGSIAAAGLRRTLRRPALGLRAAGIVALGWAGYGLALAQVPAASDLPLALVLAHRGVAALGSAAVTVLCVDLLCSPPAGAPAAARLIERLLMAAASLLTVILAQAVMWDEALARWFGRPLP